MKYSAQKKVKFLLAVALFLLLIFLFAQKTNNHKTTRYREAKNLMSTDIYVDVCLDDDIKEKVPSAYKELWERLETIAWRMNVFDAKSDVAKVNRSAGKAVEIEEDTFYVIKEALMFSDLTGGVFDITVWPLIRLWKESEKKNLIPTDLRVNEVKDMLGSDQVELLGERTVRLKNSFVSVDLGGIAKGYSVDEAAKILRHHGIKNFYIDAGGDIYVGGKNCRGQNWRIGIKDPRDASKTIAIASLSDAGITTSGDYERFFEIDGRHFSHIINPLTGYPEDEVTSATVIAPNAMAADALSTALCTLDQTQAMKLIDDLGVGYAAITLIKTPTGVPKEHRSKEFKKYVKDL